MISIRVLLPATTLSCIMLEMEECCVDSQECCVDSQECCVDSQECEHLSILINCIRSVSCFPLSSVTCDQIGNSPINSADEDQHGVLFMVRCPVMVPTPGCREIQCI